MKQKVLISGLCLTLALSLIGCGGQQAQEPQQTQNVQQSEPVISEPPVTAQPMEVKQEVSTATPPVEESQGLEDGAEIIEGAGDSEGEEPTTLNVELFTDVNETVYATGTVNIRESYTANSTKLGSLSAGQSVTRTGTSIAGTEAEGWSRIQLSDGTVAYVSNKYLSTTKPAQQSTTTNPGSQTQQPTSSTPASGGDITPGSQQNKDGWNQAFYETLTPEQKAVYEGMTSASERNMMKQSIENQRQREAEGWTTEWSDPTTDELRDAWGNIQMGQ